MKYLYLLAFCFLFGFNSQAQNFAEKGATWHYTLRDFNWLAPYNVSPISAKYTKDSIINSVKCQEITFEGGQVYMGAYYQNSAYLYQKDSVVYFWVESLKQFSTLFDFSVKKDSSWKIIYDKEKLGFKSRMFVRVDSIATRTILGRTFTSRFVVYSRDSLFKEYKYNSEIVDHIGDMQWMFNWWTNVSDGWGVTDLRCYEDSVLGFYDFGTAPSCTYTNVSIEELLNKSELKIYPNPVQNVLNIEQIDVLNSTTNWNYKLINTNGKIMQRGLFDKEKTLNTSNLPSGVYLLKLENGPVRKVFRVVKE